jgi:two-component system chemotaxis sensor kinase CheA
VKVSDYKALFISEAGEILQSLESGVMSLENGRDSAAFVEELFRNAHNLKGMSGAMGYDHVVEASHAMENVLDRCRKGEISVTRAEADLLLRSVDMLRELVRIAVDEKEMDDTDLLADYFVLLSPMTTRTLDGGRADHAAVKREEKKDDHDIEYTEDTEESDDKGEDVAADRNGLVEDGGKMDDTVPETEGAIDDNSTAPASKGSFSERVTSTRVDLERLDTLMDLVGELIISRIKLASIAGNIGSKPLNEELSSSGRLISEIQKEVMEARLIPVGQVFQRFKRLVRDSSLALEKSAKLDIVGTDIGLDRTVLEAMVDPLVHLLRNAVDHGVETPEERIAQGKPETARIVLSAKRDRNFVVLQVTDDGRGIDLEKVKEKRRAEADGAETALISEEELCKVLSTPGFSTREKVSRFSGRGVGMNVAKKAVDALGGSMRLHSEPGIGTTVSLQLPINLSIIKALLFEVGAEVHALPAEYVCETSRIERGSFRTVLGQEVMQYADEVVPVVRPGDLFGLETDASGSRYIKLILVDTGNGKVGLVAGRILGQQDIVIKGLPSLIRGASGITGATILGSGRIAFIWDPRSLFKGRCLDEPH